MSHFPLAVFTDSRPTKTQLSCQLAPYRETINNPQSKWDAWRIGGRWLGALIVRSDADDFILSRVDRSVCQTTPGAVDGARVGDLDLPTMLARNRSKLGRIWDEASAFIKEHGRPTPFMPDTVHISRVRFVERATAFTPFAYVADGCWHEKGKMGFIGEVFDPKPDDQWQDEFAKVLAQQPEDHWITILDCHI